MRYYQMMMVLLLWGLSAGLLYGQTIPLAPGSEWAYVNSDTRDTVTVRIAGNGPASLHCSGGTRTRAAWFDDAGYVYLPMNGGLVIGRRGEVEKVGAGVDPLFFLADTVGAHGQRDASGCLGTYTLIGTTTVTTPAGTFDHCLIFDDGNIHRICVKPGIGIVREERYVERAGKGATAGERKLARSRVLLRYHHGNVAR